MAASRSNQRVQVTLAALASIAVMAGCTKNDTSTTATTVAPAATANSPVPDFLGFIARSKGGEKSAAWLTAAPCMYGTDRGHMALVENFNGSPEYGCWKRENGRIVGSWYAPRTVNGETTITKSAPIDDAETEYDLLPGKQWLPTLSATSAQATTSSSPQDAPAAGWYAADTTFSECHPAKGPAARMEELLQSGLDPKTKEFRDGSGLFAVEVAYDTNDGQLYRMYYRSKERCESEMTIAGKTKRIPSAYR